MSVHKAWTVDRVRKHCGFLPHKEFLAKLPPEKRKEDGRKSGLSTELMLTAVTLALNGKTICWTAHSLRYANEQATEIRMLACRCDPNCRPRVNPRTRRSRNSSYPPGVRLGDHYFGDHR